MHTTSTSQMLYAGDMSGAADMHRWLLHLHLLQTFTGACQAFVAVTAACQLLRLTACVSPFSCQPPAN
jgi:hypothetical protein